MKHILTGCHIVLWDPYTFVSSLNAYAEIR